MFGLVTYFLLFGVFAFKNLKYFGGLNLNSLKGAIDHGLASLFDNYSSTGAFSYVLFIVLIYILFKGFKNNYFNYLNKITIIASAFGGLFGITAFLSIIVLIPQISLKSKTDQVNF